MSNARPTLTGIVRILPQTGGSDRLSQSFGNQTLVDLLLLALDFVYDEDEESLLNDMHKVMGEAEDQGKKKVQALTAWLERILDAHFPDIETAERGASSH